jgi:hypothetical protein
VVMTAAIPAPATVPVAPPRNEPTPAVVTAAAACPLTFTTESPGLAPSPSARWPAGPPSGDGSAVSCVGDSSPPARRVGVSTGTAGRDGAGGPGGGAQAPGGGGPGRPGGP